MDGIKETRGYWKLKEEALDRTVWSGKDRGKDISDGKTRKKT